MCHSINRNEQGTCSTFHHRAKNKEFCLGNFWKLYRSLLFNLYTLIVTQMTINWHFISICFIIQHNQVSWSRMRSSKRILQLTAGTEGHRGSGGVYRVRRQVYPPHVHEHFYSYTLPPSTLICSQHMNIWAPSHLTKQTHALPPRTNLISFFCKTTSSLAWWWDWRPTVPQVPLALSTVNQLQILTVEKS